MWFDPYVGLRGNVGITLKFDWRTGGTVGGDIRPLGSYPQVSRLPFCHCVGVKNLRTLIFMNEDDMKERGLAKYDLVDVTTFAKDGSTRAVRGYRAIPYNIPRGSAAGYMPELNVLCPIGDYSKNSDQPLMKHLIVSIAPSRKPQPSAAQE